MKYPANIRRAGFALVALLLLGAVAANAASAAEFQAKPSFPVRFTAKGGPGLLETKGGHSVTCLETTGSGEVAGAASVANVSVHFKGCIAEHLAALPCTSAGAASGEIVTNTISGTPVNLDTLHLQVGILLQPASGTTFAEFVCASTSGLPVKETLKVTGSVIGQVKTTDLNEFHSAITLEFVQAAGVQAWTQVEGAGASHVLLTEGSGTAPFAAEQSGVAGEATTTALEGKQIKVVP